MAENSLLVLRYPRLGRSWAVNQFGRQIRPERDQGENQTNPRKLVESMAWLIYGMQAAGGRGSI